MIYFVMGQGVFVSSQMRRLPFTWQQVIKTTFLWFFMRSLAQKQEKKRCLSLLD